VSFGLAIAPEHGTDAAALIHSASLALRSAKESGGGAVRIYGRELEMATQSRRQVEQAIGDGLANDWFELHYQPQYDLGTRRLIGFEALMRLRHPELGLMLPSTFVPVAEESGLIQPLGERLVKEALATAATWPSHVSLSICVAAGQFRHGDVAAGILAALAHAKVEGTRLRVKVPEAVLLAPTERSGEQLHRLRAAKVAVAIDGFGRHASNLKSLAEGICGTAILDGTVVAGIGRSTGEETFVRRLIDAARAFGLDVRAEGVERAEQAHFLALHGCLKVQGLLFGAPVAATEIAAIIAKDVRNAVAGGVSLRSISAA
jgi:EAL domain-containing protein (putative c-di-GMP-specific phosphodiesterase class I)